MYRGSNIIVHQIQNFPLVLTIKLHLKMSVNYQLQISPPPNIREIITCLDWEDMRFQS